MQRVLIAIGLLVLVIGLAWPWISTLPFGRLPGDIIIHRPGLKIYLPLATSLLLSLILSLLVWLLRR